MNIYKNYIPFTYLIGWTIHNKWYYGRRTAKNCHPNDLWTNYFSSSKEVKNFRKQYGEPDIIQIRKTFPNNPNACKLWECRVLEKIDAKNNYKFLNKKNGDHKWDTTGISPTIYEDTLEKRKKTCLKNYNSENAFSNEEIKNKIKRTNYLKYGVENPSCSDEIKTKKQQTCYENFGVTNPSKSKEIQTKKKLTSLIKNGVTHHSKIKKECFYCGIISTEKHEMQCLKNPNRVVFGFKKEKHPNAKTFKVVSPEGKQFFVCGSLKNFCKENLLSFSSLYYRKKYKGWTLERM